VPEVSKPRGLYHRIIVMTLSRAYLFSIAHTDMLAQLLATGAPVPITRAKCE